MHPFKKENLMKKGWSEEEIKKAEQILEQAEAHDLFFSQVVFWSALLVIIFANLLVSLILIPFLIFFNQWFLYLITFILGGTVGFLYNFLIMDIGHLEKKHHLLAGILVPVLALINLIIMVIVSNQFIRELKIKNSPHNFVVVGLVFVIAFILPYLIDRFRGKHYFSDKN